MDLKKMLLEKLVEEQDEKELAKAIGEECGLDADFEREGREIRELYPAQMGIMYHQTDVIMNSMKEAVQTFMYICLAMPESVGNHGSQAIARLLKGQGIAFERKYEEGKVRDAEEVAKNKGDKKEA